MDNTKSNRFARRIIVAAAMVFGAEDAARAIEDDSSSNAAWKQRLEEAIEMAVQREYSARLQLTASGRKLLAFKPRFGLAKYLVAAAMDPRIPPLMVVRLLQFRTGGHHLQCMVDRWRADGHTTPCRCGADIEDVPHLFFACGSTAVQRAALMAELRAALAKAEGAVEAMTAAATMGPEVQWQWLNEILDARNQVYLDALPAVLVAVTEFIKRVLAVHPLYGGR